MEQGISVFLKEKANMLAGRKVELISADTGGNPAGAKTKAQELIERDKVHVVIGPLAAFELPAILDYVRDNATPLMSLAAAEDVTQRRANPFMIRASASSAQCCHVLGDYAAKYLKYHRAAAIAEDTAFGYEQFCWLSARVRGQWWQGHQEAVAASRDAGLHPLHRPDHQGGLLRERIGRVESGEVHALLRGSRAGGQSPAASRMDCHGRCFAA